MKQIRTVTLVKGANTNPGAKTTLWAYDAQALATASGFSLSTVCRYIRWGWIDPENFLELAKWVLEHSPEGGNKSTELINRANHLEKYKFGRQKEKYPGDIVIPQEAGSPSQEATGPPMNKTTNGTENTGPHSP